MYQVLCEDVQHKAALREGPDIISQGHLPGVTPPCVCRRVARKLRYAQAWVQLCHDLRVRGREASHSDSCHHFSLCLLGADTGEDCPVSPILHKPVLAGADHHTKTSYLHEKHNPCCWNAVTDSIATK